MVTTVRLFAGLRERAGAASIEVELPDTGATVADLLRALADSPIGELPDRTAIVAVNREYATRDQPIAPGDEVALIPPVSGGAGAVRLVAVTADPIDVDSLRALVRDPAAGAVVVFEGTTRTVAHLDYEAYEPMASERIARIAAEEAERHGVLAVAVVHRTGRVARSEPSVVVAVAGAHRGETFAAARALIDRVKAEAPIWKKEDEEWVEGTLPPASDPPAG